MRAFTLIAAVLAAAGVALAQAPAPSQAPCPWQCPPTDDMYNDLVSSEDGPYDTIICTYDGYGTCTYSTKDGILGSDDDDGNCPYYADKPCASKRFNIVKEIAKRRATKPAPSVPTAVAKRAALKKKRAD